MRVFLFKFIMGFFARLSLSWNHKLGAGLGWLMAKMNTRLYQTVVKNVLQCYPAEEAPVQQRFMRATIQETAKTITEMGPMWWWPQDRVLGLVVNVSGKAVLDRAMADGRGVILAAPHLGAWELIGLYCSAHYPMTSLYRPPRMAALDPIVRQARQRGGATLVPTDNHGVKKLLKALKKREMIAILPDQEPKKGTGMFAPFFNQPAYTMILLSRLAQKTQAAVIFSFAERLPNGAGYHVHFMAGDAEIADRDMAISVAAVNRGVERCIQQCPTQYQWSYKRFRLKPNT